MANDIPLVRARWLHWYPFPTLFAFAIVGIALPAAADDALNPRGNIERAIELIEEETDQAVINMFRRESGDDPKVHCIENRFCESRLGELRIEAMGRQIEITPAPRTPPEHLVNSCVGLLRAFAGQVSAQEATNAVHQALERVLDGSVTTVKTQAFKFVMKLNSESLPSCRLVRFVQR